MLVSKQLTDTLLDNARIIRKESLELRHNCRNTMCISRTLRSIMQEDRQSRPSGGLGTLFDPNKPPKGTA